MEGRKTARAAAEALGTDVHSIAYGKLFNISIVKDGVEYQPNDSATVTVELLDAASVSDVQVVHFDNEDNATKLNASTEGKAVTFETDGFSIFSFLDFSIVSKSIEAALAAAKNFLEKNQ